MGIRKKPEREKKTEANKAWFPWHSPSGTPWDLDIISTLPLLDKGREVLLRA